jgi:hypothetical protein
LVVEVEVVEFQDLMVKLAQQMLDSLVVVVEVGAVPQVVSKVEGQVIKDMVVQPHFISMEVRVEEWVKQVKQIVGVYQQEEVMVRMH